MPTPTKGPRLGGGPAHERLILANLATSLFEHDSITTTEAKAKRLRPLAERLITFAKRGDLHARRRVMTVIRDKAPTTLTIKIGEQPGEETVAAVAPREEMLGLKVEPLTPESAQRFKLTAKAGVVVTDVATGSSGESAATL